MENKDHMILCEEIIKIFAAAMRKIFSRENSEDKYMKQTFLGCRFRAFVAIAAAVKESFKPMYKILALAIAKHRTEKHGDSKEKTIATLSRSMTTSEIKAATNSGWLN